LFLVFPQPPPLQMATRTQSVPDNRFLLPAFEAYIYSPHSSTFGPWFVPTWAVTPRATNRRPNAGLPIAAASFAIQNPLRWFLERHNFPLKMKNASYRVGDADRSRPPKGRLRSTAAFISFSLARVMVEPRVLRSCADGNFPSAPPPIEECQKGVKHKDCEVRHYRVTSH
jgi:hypothetical protein